MSGWPAEGVDLWVDQERPLQFITQATLGDQMFAVLFAFQSLRNLSGPVRDSKCYTATSCSLLKDSEGLFAEDALSGHSRNKSSFSEVLAETGSSAHF